MNNFNEWCELGSKIKEVRTQLRSILNEEKYQTLIKDKKINAYLWNTLKQIDKFRDKAEDKMFATENPPRHEDVKWFHVFYGDNEESNK